MHFPRAARTAPWFPLSLDSSRSPVTCNSPAREGLVAFLATSPPCKVEVSARGAEPIPRPAPLLSSPHKLSPAAATPVAPLTPAAAAAALVAAAVPKHRHESLKSNLPVIMAFLAFVRHRAPKPQPPKSAQPNSISRQPISNSDVPEPLNETRPHSKPRTRMRCIRNRGKKRQCQNSSAVKC